jgi:fatty-acyl-CoA synthase
MLLNTPSAQHIDLKGWKMVLGGSALSPSLAQSALARGMDVWSRYGMSETGPMLVLSRLQSESSIGGDDETQIRCKQGVPIPLVDLRIVDEDMRSLPWDGVSVGEVVARAPWLTMAYAGDETASAALWRGGYLHTQDAASLDPSGYVVLCDRMKDIIKSGGEWVSSLLLEDLISRHSEVAEVAVIAIPDARWGERPMALVVPRPEFRTVLTAESIRAHMIQFVDSGRLKRHDIPDRIDFVESLARTSVGKIDKKLIREHVKSNFAAAS